jgi:flagellar FliJ protein
MKRFQYRLETLLRLKRQLKRLAELNQREAQRKLDAATAKVRAWEQQLDVAAAGLAQHLGIPAPAREYLSRQDVVQLVQREIGDARQRRGQAEQAWQRAREQLSRLSAQEEMLQNHRDRQWQEHHHDQERAVLNQMDDFVLRRWALGVATRKGGGDHV